MIKFEEYHLVKVKNKDKEHAKSTLIAKLRFWDEVKPKDREDIRQRIAYKKRFGLTESFSQKRTNVVTYLQEKGLKGEYKSRYPNDGDRLSYFSKNYIRYKVKSLPRRLGLNISATVDREIGQENFLNLEELNDFILTGIKNDK